MQEKSFTERLDTVRLSIRWLRVRVPSASLRSIPHKRSPQSAGNREVRRVATCDLSNSPKRPAEPDGAFCCAPTGLPHGRRARPHHVRFRTGISKDPRAQSRKSARPGALPSWRAVRKHSHWPALKVSQVHPMLDPREPQVIQAG
jgi:hypothetical protein